MMTTLLSIAAIFLGLVLGAFVLLQKRQRSLSSSFLALSLLLMAIIETADRLALENPQLWLSAKSVGLTAESFLGAAWLLYALTFARRQPLRNLSRTSMLVLAGSLVLPVLALQAPVESFFFSPDFDEERILFLGRNAYYFYLWLLFFTIVALYQLERTLMAFTRLERSRILHEIVGIGIVLVAMLIYYSPAFLHRTIDMNLTPIRTLALLTGVGLCGYSRFRRESAKTLLVSRDVASRSFVVLAVGCYILLLGGAGEGLRYFGLQEEQRLFFTGFAVLTGLALALMLLSEKNRRKLNVFLHKHFYHQKYDYRNQWLMFTNKLSSADNMAKLQDAILDFYCETFGRKGAALYLLDTETGVYRQKCSRELEFPQASFARGHSLIEYFDGKNWIFNLDDSHPPAFDQVKHQFESFKLKLCVPLQHEQALEGFILLSEPLNPDEALNYEDYDLMKMLSRQATSVLLSLKLSAQLSAARELAALGKVSTFVVHDLKNHISNLSLMVDNAREHIDNPEFQTDMLETLDETICKIKNLIARLKNIKEKKVLNLATCDLTEIVRRGAKAGGAQPGSVRGEPVLASIDAEEIEKVVHNLVLNAHEAGASNGSLTVDVGIDETIFFEVTDEGCGMSQEFIRDRLFKPFQTTKPKGFGIGLFQCRQIIEAHGGEIEVASKVGEGTSFRVRLPAVAE